MKKLMAAWDAYYRGEGMEDCREDGFTRNIVRAKRLMNKFDRKLLEFLGINLIVDGGINYTVSARDIDEWTEAMIKRRQQECDSDSHKCLLEMHNMMREIASHLSGLNMVVQSMIVSLAEQTGRARVEKEKI